MQGRQIPFIRGTVFLGPPGSGKSFLMQYRALDALRRQPEAHLLYVSAPARQDPILALQPGARVVREEGGMILIEAERMKAFLCDADTGQADREGLIKEAKTAITQTLALASLSENHRKCILAIDEVFAFFRKEKEINALFELLEGVLDAPTSSLTFLITFQTLNQIGSGFGKRGVELFRRLHEKFIFKTFEEEVNSFANCGDVNPLALQRGEAVHVYHGLSEVVEIGLDADDAVTIKPHHLKPVGLWRRREIRGESMAQPLAGFLCLLMLGVSALTGIRLFIAYQPQWATRPGANMGTLFYAGSIAAAAFLTHAYPHMKNCLAAMIVAASRGRRRKHIPGRA